MTKISKIIYFAFFLTSLGCSALEPQKTFQPFWTEFRSASLKSDYGVLTSLIQFPLEVRGVDDQTPSKFYSSKQLPEIFSRLLKQSIYSYEKDDVVEVSFKELLRQKEFEAVEPESRNHRVGQFEFKNIDGRWLLIRAYLEE